MSKNRIWERKTLIFATCLNIVLGGVGVGFGIWLNSSAILFDGCYSLLMTITTIVALCLSFNIHTNKKNNYPMGKWLLEHIFSAFKSILIIGVCGYFLIDACLSLNVVINSPQDLASLPNYTYYIIYTCLVIVISIFICSFFYYGYIKMKKHSVLIKVEIKGAIIDLSISVAIGISLTIVSAIYNSNFDSLEARTTRGIIDSVLVIVFILGILYPIIKTLIEQINILSSKRIYTKIEQDLIKEINSSIIDDIYIKKMGNEQVIYIFVNSLKMPDKFLKEKKRIEKQLNKKYDNLELYFTIQEKRQITNK